MGQNTSGGWNKNLWVWLTPLIILAVSYLAAFISYPFLPAQIPLQWGLNGVNRYAGKDAIYLIALLPAFIFVLLRAKYGRK